MPEITRQPANPATSAPQAPGAIHTETDGLATRTPKEGYWLVERPDSALAQGQYAWPAWGVATVGAVIVVGGLLYLLVRFRRARASQ